MFCEDLEGWMGLGGKEFQEGKKEASGYRLRTAPRYGLYPMSVKVLLDYW